MRWFSQVSLSSCRNIKYYSTKHKLKVKMIKSLKGINCWGFKVKMSDKINRQQNCPRLLELPLHLSGPKNFKKKPKRAKEWLSHCKVNSLKLKKALGWMRSCPKRSCSFIARFNSTYQHRLSRQASSTPRITFGILRPKARNTCRSFLGICQNLKNRLFKIFHNTWIPYAISYSNA
jgi:hypothetical protein